MMKKLLIALGLSLALIGLVQAQTINGLVPGTALGGTEQIPMFQTAVPAVTTTPSAISTYLQTLGVYVTLTGSQTLTNKSISAGQVNSGTLAAAQMPALSGDITTSAGAVATTLATVNSNVGSFGSATSCAAFTVNGKGLITAASASTCAPAIGSVTGLGTGVGTALGNALSAAGGVSSTIFHGTATLGTGAITSGTCATAVNVTAANVATTDVVTAGFSADPTATTGYLPTAMLTIVPYVASAGNIAVKVCNLTAGSITPSALTVNVSAVR